MPVAKNDMKTPYFQMVGAFRNRTAKKLMKTIPKCVKGTEFLYD